MTPHRRQFLRAAASATLGAPLLALRGQPGADLNASTEADVMTGEARRLVDRGLLYLTSAQARDGSWGDREGYRGHVAVTALGGLALLAGGHTPRSGPYAGHARKAVEYLLECESREPAGLIQRGDANRQGMMYGHGFGTLFLAECLGAVGDQKLQTRLESCVRRAIKLIVGAQNAEGGWRYEPTPTQADVSVTACQLMALRAARNAGIAVPASAAANGLRYVKSCQTADGGFGYFTGQGESEFARSAAGLVAMYSCGEYGTPEARRALSYLAAFNPAKSNRREMNPQHFYYGHYYAMQAMWGAGGNHLGEWYPAAAAQLSKPQHLRREGGWRDPVIGDHYATAMACIALQVPNDYLPITER